MFREATGLASQFVIKQPTEQDYRFRFNVYPNSHQRAGLAKSR